MTIAGLAHRGGVGVETIRYYQRRGLLQTPPRAGSVGHGRRIRRYVERDLQQLRFIRKAQSVGFTLAQIADLLVLDATEDRARARALAKERMADLDVKIGELQQARNALSRLARQCAASTGPCPIIAAFN